MPDEKGKLFFLNFHLRERPLPKLKLKYLKGSYEVQKFPLSPTVDLLLNFFPINKVHGINVFVKNQIGKKLEIIYNYAASFEVVEIAW